MRIPTNFWNQKYRTLAFAMVWLSASNIAYGDDGGNSSAKSRVIIYSDDACKITFKEVSRSFEKEITAFYKKSEVSEIVFDEGPRDTVLISQLKVLAENKKELFESMNKSDSTCVKASSYSLKYVRANLKITATSADEKSKQSFNVVTGPVEHWYLAFDLPVSSRKTLKYDQATKSLLPQDKNPELYLSFNYSPEDIVENQHKWAVKLLLQISQRPIDSFGIGLSRRLSNNFLGLGDFSSLSVFVGRFWTRQDALSANGTPQLNHATDQSWRGGISYDFNTGLPWFK